MQGTPTQVRRDRAAPFAITRSAHQDNIMYAPWVTSSTALPDEGQAVEFVLDGREVAMGGVYVQRTFRSRWSGYEVERVRTWRSADSDDSDQNRRQSAVST
ncbi:hypothetical protein [Metallibacterium sp.]